MSIEAIVGVVATLLGQILGWGLGLITNKIGKLHVSVEYAYYDIKYQEEYATVESTMPNVNELKYIGNKKDYMIIEFVVVVFNNKFNTLGINNCKVYIEYDNRERHEVFSLIADGSEVNELENLLNIDAKTTKKAKYRQRHLFINPDKERDKFKIFLEYKINGKKKASRRLLLDQKE